MLRQLLGGEALAALRGGIRGGGTFHRRQRSAISDAAINFIVMHSHCSPDRPEQRLLRCGALLVWYGCRAK